MIKDAHLKVRIFLLFSLKEKLYVLGSFQAADTRKPIGLAVGLGLVGHIDSVALVKSEGGLCGHVLVSLKSELLCKRESCGDNEILGRDLGIGLVCAAVVNSVVGDLQVIAGNGMVILVLHHKAPSDRTRVTAHKYSLAVDSQHRNDACVVGAVGHLVCVRIVFEKHVGSADDFNVNVRDLESLTVGKLTNRNIGSVLCENVVHILACAL